MALVPLIPNIIPVPFGHGAQRTIIPTLNPDASSPQASWTSGFPPVTMINKQAGGKPPLGRDFNSILYELSSHAYFSQSGCVYPWVGADAANDFAGLNYLKGSHVLGSDGEEYIALKPSGPDVPATDGRFIGPVDPVGENAGGYWKRMNAENTIPSGFIGMWSGAVDQIPEGWLLCDGQNGTPDLRDRFIVGAGNAYAVGENGGATSVTPAGSVSNTVAGGTVANHTLSQAQIAAHSHVIPLRYAQSGLGGGNSSAFGPNGGESVYPTAWDGGGNGAHNHGFGGISHGHTFTGVQFDNRPLYYSLAYIMKL